MSQVSPQVADGGERVVEVVGGLTRVAGFMGVRQQRYTLVITDRRIVFAELTKEKVRELAHLAKDHAREIGKGALGQLGAQAGVPWTAAEAYRAMSPEEVLGESPGNFAVDRTEVRKVRFKLGSTEAAAETVTIRTASDTYKLQVGGSFRGVKEAFARAGLV
ncbi:hypothetical protein [Nocardioides pacificus]